MNNRLSHLDHGGHQWIRDGYAYMKCRLCGMTASEHIARGDVHWPEPRMFDYEAGKKYMDELGRCTFARKLGYWTWKKWFYVILHKLERSGMVRSGAWGAITITKGIFSGKIINLKRWP